MVGLEASLPFPTSTLIWLSDAALNYSVWRSNSSSVLCIIFSHIASPFKAFVDKIVLYLLVVHFRAHFHCTYISKIYYFCFVYSCVDRIMLSEIKPAQGCVVLHDFSLLLSSSVNCMQLREIGLRVVRHSWLVHWNYSPFGMAELIGIRYGIPINSSDTKHGLFLRSSACLTELHTGIFCALMLCVRWFPLSYVFRIQPCMQLDGVSRTYHHFHCFT